MWERPLRTFDGDPIQILDPGRWNPGEGPDFLDARIRIREVQWVGAVEIHYSLEDWEKHAHSEHPAYRTVILHVVLEPPSPEVYRRWKNQQRIPLVVMRTALSEERFSWLKAWFQSSRTVLCGERLRRWRRLDIVHLWENALLERMNMQKQRVQYLLERTRYQWLEVLAVRLARALGSPWNGEAMEEVVLRTGWHLLSRYLQRPVERTLLLFLAGGFYLDRGPEHFQMLQEVMKAKYPHLVEQNRESPIQWKRGGIRPQHFPAVRLVQFSVILPWIPVFWHAMIHGEWKDVENIFDQMERHVHEEPWDQVWKALQDAGWVPEIRCQVVPGGMFRQYLVINGLIPVLFAGGKEEKALRWLEQLPPENHHVVRIWTRETGWKPRCAGDSQAILQLVRERCRMRRCGLCPVFHRELNRWRDRNLLS